MCIQYNPFNWSSDGESNRLKICPILFVTKSGMKGFSGIMVSYGLHEASDHSSCT